MSERAAQVVGIRRQEHHPLDCRCEGCGRAFLVLLSEYEATRLLAHLEETAGTEHDTGDWHGQLRWKLSPLIDAEQRRYFGAKARPGEVPVRSREDDQG